MLIVTVALSFAAALGVSSLFFSHVFGYGNADNSFPLFVFVFLVALASLCRVSASTLKTAQDHAWPLLAQAGYPTEPAGPTLKTLQDPPPTPRNTAWPSHKHTALFCAGSLLISWLRKPLQSGQFLGVE